MSLIVTLISIIFLLLNVTQIYPQESRKHEQESNPLNHRHRHQKLIMPFGNAVLRITTKISLPGLRQKDDSSVESGLTSALPK